jgi:hypothetical protein
MIYRLRELQVTPNCVQANLKVCICLSQILHSGFTQMMVTGESPAVDHSIAVLLAVQACRTFCARVWRLKGMVLSKEFQPCVGATSPSN